MSFLERISAVNQYNPNHFRPFWVAGKKLGFVKHAFAETLTRWQTVFSVDDGSVSLSAALTSVAVRSHAVAEVLHTLRDEGLVPGWRDERYPVSASFSEPPYLVMERAAVPLFGIRAYGIHVNGFVHDAGGIKMWVAQRSQSKPTEPGKLDQLVAGGQPIDIGLRDNVLKECWEEAGIPAEIARQAKPVGAISYCRETSQGLRPDVIFAFDLELPADFTPVNQDGEVAAFFLWPMERVISTVQDSIAFKANCALVVIHFLIRHGFVDPEHPDYLTILQSLLSGYNVIPS
jgi:8-oxo-dGTP pyrophosphatase MutT (NUDIX family)